MVSDLDLFCCVLEEIFQVFEVAFQDFAYFCSDLFFVEAVVNWGLFVVWVYDSFKRLYNLILLNQYLLILILKYKQEIPQNHVILISFLKTIKTHFNKKFTYPHKLQILILKLFNNLLSPYPMSLQYLMRVSEIFGVSVRGR